MNLAQMNSQFLVLFALIAIGYVAYKTKLLGSTASKAMSDLVLNVTCPATILYNIISGEINLSKSTVLLLLGAALAMHVGLALLAELITRIIPMGKDQRGIYQFMIVFTNCGFIGFPVAYALSGSDGVLIATLYVLIFNLLAYTYGVTLIATNPEQKKLNFKSFLKPTVLSAVIAFALFFANVKVPQGIVRVLGMLSDANTPVSTLVIGCSMAAYPLKDVLGNWRVYVITAIKLVVVPVIFFFVLRLFFTDPLILGILTVMTALPSATSLVLLAHQYESDLKQASACLFLSTLFSMITIPVLLGILF